MNSENEFLPNNSAYANYLIAHRVKCEHCGQYLQNKDSLRRHLNKFHPHRTKQPSHSPKMVCGMCNGRFSRNEEFECHIKDTHGVDVVHDKLSFESKDEFTAFLHSAENRYKAKFVEVSCSKKSPNRTRIYYRCNRSGPPRSRVSQEERKRQPKTQGSCKSNNHCTARITATLLHDGTVLVDFCKTHFGHKIELKHLPKKRELASEIAAEVPLVDGVGKIERSFDENKDLEGSPDLFIDEPENLNETTALEDSVGSSESVLPQNSISDNVRKSVEESISFVMNEIQNDDEMLIFGKIVKSAIPVLKAARNQRAQSSALKTREKVENP